LKKIIYICSPIGQRGIENKFGVYDEASITLLRYKIIEKLGKEKKIELCFKLGYGIELRDKLLLKKIKDFNFNYIPSAESFLKYANEADGFFIELLSTSLFESVKFQKPILLLADEYGFLLAKNIEKIIEQEMVLCKNPSDFIDKAYEFSSNFSDFEASCKTEYQGFINLLIKDPGMDPLKSNLEFLGSLI